MLQEDYFLDDEELDVPAPFTEEILKEFELDSKLKSISLFKNCACKEPNLYGIQKLSDYKIFTILETSKKYNEINKMTVSEILLFEDLFVSMYGVPSNIYVYNDMYKKLIKETSV